MRKYGALQLAVAFIRYGLRITRNENRASNVRIGKNISQYECLITNLERAGGGREM